jgi:hypothetical protein
MWPSAPSIPARSPRPLHLAASAQLASIRARWVSRSVRTVRCAAYYLPSSISTMPCHPHTIMCVPPHRMANTSPLVPRNFAPSAAQEKRVEVQDKRQIARAPTAWPVNLPATQGQHPAATAFQADISTQRNQIPRPSEQIAKTAKQAGMYRRRERRTRKVKRGLLAVRCVRRASTLVPRLTTRLVLRRRNAAIALRVQKPPAVIIFLASTESFCARRHMAGEYRKRPGI